MPSMKTLRFVTTDVQQTISFGKLLGTQLQRGDVVLLSGDLGAGKTHLTKGIVLGTGSNDQVTSPTFVFMNEYRTTSRTILYHLDLYRITSPAELDGIGIADATAGHGIAVIEWPEHDPSLTEIPHLSVRLDHINPTTREIICTAHGPRAQRIITALAEQWPHTKDQGHDVGN